MLPLSGDRNCSIKADTNHNYPPDYNLTWIPKMTPYFEHIFSNPSCLVSMLNFSGVVSDYNDKSKMNPNEFAITHGVLHLLAS